MPFAPQKPCAQSGCSALAVQGETYCAKHKQAKQKQKKEQDKKRGPSCKRGYGRVWQKYRLIYLTEHPICMECKKQNRITPATVVDHIKAHKGDMELFWEKDNHQALCKKCHDRKTAREDGGFGR